MKITLMILSLALAIASSAFATELTYRPANPSFGGNPSTGAWLLSNYKAQEAKERRSSSRSPSEQASRADRLQSSLESRIISNALRDIESDDFLNGGSRLVTLGDGTSVGVIRGEDGSLTVDIKDADGGTATIAVQGYFTTTASP